MLCFDAKSERRVLNLTLNTPAFWVGQRIDINKLPVDILHLTGMLCP